MNLIIGTKNKAKIEQIKGVLAPLKINVAGLPDGELPDITEDGKTAIDNARIKAVTYAKAINQLVLSMDNALYFDDLPDDRQPGVHVRRINSGNNRPTDDELLTYYSRLISDLGDKIKGHWEYGICLAHPDGRTFETAIISPRIFVSHPSDTKIEGYPLESIQIDPQSGKYISEMSQAEQDEFWQKSIGQELCDFLFDKIN